MELRSLSTLQSSSDVIFKFILCCGIFVKGGQVTEEEIVRDFNTNVTLPCRNTQNEVIRWEKEGKISKQVLPNGDLFLENVQRNDSGLYQCSTAAQDEILSRIRLVIHSPPAALKNITVVPATVYALIKWQSEADDIDSITNITIKYKEENSVEWHYSHRENPSNEKVEIFELKPNSSYVFQIWASNKLGRGEITNVTAKTLHDNEEIAVERRKDDPERIELIPNIIVNPGCSVSGPLSCSQLKIGGSADEDDEEMTTEYFACCNGAKVINV
ncbi:hypothetical protein ACP70R_050173 [Stipagrostis hirtigluma subsp. patula]